MRRRRVGQWGPAEERKTEVEKRGQGVTGRGSAVTKTQYRVVFALALSMRLVNAWTTPVADCDETYNYWEPLHYMVRGVGLQTWEYSPEYALRSYGSLGLFAGVVRVWDLAAAALGFTSDVATFYVVRVAMAALTAWMETVFWKSTTVLLGFRVGALTAAFSLLAPGMAHASVALLPSTMAMWGVQASFAFWMTYLARPTPARSKLWAGALFLGAFAVVGSGWPFVGVVFVPMGLSMIARVGVVRVAVVGAISTAIQLLPIALADRMYYGRWVVALWNLVRYNVLDSSRGPGLYGVEPWHYYVVNLGLNFNVAMPLAAVSLPVSLVFLKWAAQTRTTTTRTMLALLLPLYLWMALMLRLPHKEERFLYVVYPLISLAAAVALACVTEVAAVYAMAVARWFGRSRVPLLAPAIRRLDASIRGDFYHAASFALPSAVLLVYALLAAARVASMASAYGAPLAVYADLADRLPPSADPTAPPRLVCVGKEWYRFPSSFFLPRDDSVRLAFVKSGFSGLLPQYYAPFPTGSSIIPPHMNDMNREEPSRYVNLDACDYYVDVLLPDQSEPPPPSSSWNIIISRPFLDANRTPSISRALVPALYGPRIYVPYNVYERKPT